MTFRNSDKKQSLLLILANEKHKNKSLLSLMAICFSVVVFFVSCQQKPKPGTENTSHKMQASCSSSLPSRFGIKVANTSDSLGASSRPASHQGMKYITGGSFTMGATDKNGRDDEYPMHQVKLDGFWIDETEVTNKQFAAFVKATGYITIAEKKPDWEELKKQLPQVHQNHLMMCSFRQH